MQKKENLELVFGIHPIIELLKAKRRKIYSIYTTKPVPKAWHDVEKLLPKGTNIQYVSREALNKLAQSTDHQSVVALATPAIIRKKFFDASKHKFLIMLDRIQDPRNLGAIIRSAYCTSGDGIILTSKNSSPLNAVALKASAGLAEHLDIYQAPSAAAACIELKNAGYNIYFATIAGADARKVEFKLPACIVIGNEAQGIEKNILSNGVQVSLPQKNSDISYNASVAAGILLYTVATKHGLI